MTTPKHYDTWADVPSLSVRPDGTTYTNKHGQIRRYDAEIRGWEDTDTPAPPRADDPPWYREPTADKPGQVECSDYPDGDWEWRSRNDGVNKGWSAGPLDPNYHPHAVIEARRIEPEPDPATVTVMLEDLESVVNYIDPTNSVLTHWGILDRFRAAIKQAQR